MAPAEEDHKPPSQTKLNKKELRRIRSELITRRSRVLKPLEERISQIEQEIETNEQRINDLNEEMLIVSQSPEGTRIAEISKALHTCKSNIDRLFDELEEVTESFEEKSAYFEEEFAKIGIED